MEETPFEDRVVPRVEVDWDRSFWWWYPVTRAIHPAIRMTSLFVGLMGIVLLRFGLGLADTWFGPSFDLRIVASWTEWYWWKLPTLELRGDFPALTIDHFAYFSFVLVWVALVSGILGSVLARRAAIELGQRNIASWIDALTISFRRLISSLWAAGMYVVALAALLLPILILGWISRLGTVAGTITGVLLLTVCIPLIFAAGRTLVSLVICFPLSICAISIERKADAFEGFSRSNAYLFQRPIVSVLVIAALAILGEVGAFLVYWTVQLGWGLASHFYLTAAGQEVESWQFYEFGTWLATNLIAAYRFTYFWSAVAALYLILRRSVDNTELEEVDMSESQVAAVPPPLPTTSQPAQGPTSQPSSNDS